MSEKPIDENIEAPKKEPKKKSKPESKGLAKSFKFDEKKHESQPWLKEFDGKTFFEIHSIIESRMG